MVKKLIIDVPSLKLGDVILTSEKGLASKGVRAATLSKYSHAAIYVGGTMIEATLGGVFSKNPQRLLFDSERQVAVYRYRAELDENQIKNVCNYARSKTASLYTIPEAATLRIREILNKPESKKQFCSRLVALSYSENGVDLGNIRNPAYCTPKQLSLCKVFYKVNNIVREAEEHEIAFAKTDDPNIPHQKDTIAWVNKVRELVKIKGLSKDFDIQSITDVDEFLELNHQYDELVVSYINSGGYLTHYNFDTKRNPYRYNPILLESVVKERNNKDAFFNEQLSKELDIINLYSENLNRYLNYYVNYNLNYYREHCLLYMNLLTGIYVRAKFLHQVSKKYSNDDVANISGEVLRVAAVNCGKGKEILGIQGA
ncbi:hypothetical protein BJL83_23310 [Vibrio parahaemolyticus]|nr:hypothetical protein BJL83_23310 [Vibrio parahaemolyticus]